MNGNKTTSANSTHGGGEYKSLDLFEILDTDELPYDLLLRQFCTSKHVKDSPC